MHTPECSFEHDVQNVRRAAREMAIDYPIAIDNDCAIWRAFDNQYWPALYVIDPLGRVRTITLEKGSTSSPRCLFSNSWRKPVLPHPPRAWFEFIPPVSRRRRLGTTCDLGKTTLGTNAPRISHGLAVWERDRRRRYSAPALLALNQWALVGDWTVGRQATASTTSGARIVNRFHARDLHLVMEPLRGGSRPRFRVTIDGRQPGLSHGVDADEGGNGAILDQRLYQLIRQPKPIVDRQFEIELLDGGVEAYAFTFG